MKETELICNPDGSIFHLNLHPHEISDKIIIVGDPGRVELIGNLFDSQELKKSNREFFTITGMYKGKRLSVISSGIGTDNIDILINELDALRNFNLQTKQALPERNSLTLVRLGTSGGLQADLGPGESIITKKAIGFDSVLNYYKGIDKITDHKFEKLFMKHTDWSERLPSPYIIDADKDLLSSFSEIKGAKGLTISTPGFYAPQGRSIGLQAWHSDINARIESFEYLGDKILNYEMESSAIYGLASLMGHRALTICTAIGNRVTGKFINDYRPLIKDLAIRILEII